MIDGFSIIMPTYNQSSFIRRAIQSLFLQTYNNWELIIVNDGCTDNTLFYISEFLEHPKIKYIQNEFNEGLGYALNQGLKIAKYNYIGYLPSDDYYFKNHLETIFTLLTENKDLDIALIYTGIKFDTIDTMSLSKSYIIESKGPKKNFSLQLVQTVHKKNKELWVERKEWVTDDLYQMYWIKLLDKGIFTPTNQVTCYWTDHPKQRHKIIGDKYGGGINIYRSYYNIKDPIKLRVSGYKFINEEKLYAPYRKKNIPKNNSLKILLVGELAYNSERIYALEEAGHQLYGLWVDEPEYAFNTVGPLPFGHVKDLSLRNWKEEIKIIQPDIIYALLNFGAVPLAYKVLKHNPDIPFIWHFKEGPSVCLQRGTWDKLLYLYTFADGKIFLNETVKAWFEQFIPSSGLSYILDGDLPKINYFTNDFSARLSEINNEIHTIVAGRIIGLHPEIVRAFAKAHIHIHFYLDCDHENRKFQINYYQNLAPDYIHSHAHCEPADWVKEFSQYDAGWLHCFRSSNHGELINASWDDLNIPARINTYAAAGLPVILPDNQQQIVAIQNKIQLLDIGILYKNADDLIDQLKNTSKMNLLRKNILKNRKLFCFDHYIPELIMFFREVIKTKKYHEE